MTLRLVAVLAALSVATLACTSGAAPPNLADRMFLSTAVTVGGEDRPLVAGTRIRLQFGRDGTLGVNAGCNHMGGTWRVVDGRLEVTAGAMTEMGCDEPRHAQDDWVIDVLSAHPAMVLTDRELVLATQDVEIRLLDREVAEPDRPLVGPVWTVDTIVDGDVAMGMAEGATATVQFLPDGGASINTGCNEGQATVTEVGDGVLRFGAIAMTKRGCAGPPAELERSVLAVLSAGEVSWSIDADALSLQAGPLALLLRAP